MAEQLTSRDLETMTAEEIASATLRGELNNLLNGANPYEAEVEQARADWLAAKAETEAAKPAAVDQGARGRPRSDGQVTAAELATMTPEAIAKATAQGRMTDLLGG